MQASSSSVVAHTPAMPYIFHSDDPDDSNGSSTDDEYFIDTEIGTYNFRVGQYDQDQDWVLCDKDCGWCGHCGDNVDY
jgi:hypothetical protein